MTAGLEVDEIDVLAAVRLRFKTPSGASDDFDTCEEPGFFGGRGGGGGQVDIPLEPTEAYDDRAGNIGAAGDRSPVETTDAYV